MKTTANIIRAILAGALILGTFAHGQEPLTNPKPHKKHHLSKRTILSIAATAAASGAIAYAANQGAQQKFARVHFPIPVRPAR